MAKGKYIKTNAMRILDKSKVQYRVQTYECDEFVDGITIADKLGQNYALSFKTLVTKGRSGSYYVFVIPIAEELDLKKAAKSVKEKNIEMVHVKDINNITGYIRGGCSPLGMKKQYFTVIHESAEKFEEIIISGGRIGSQIILNPNDLLRVIGGRYDDITVA